MKFEAIIRIYPEISPDDTLGSAIRAMAQNNASALVVRDGDEYKLTTPEQSIGRLKAFHGNDQFIGMDFKEPSIHYTDMARSMGLNAERVETGDALDDALARTFAGDKPTLLEVMVDGSV